MALNPLAYTEKVVESFLRYQLTAYPFADRRLHEQMRDLLSLQTARETPLLKGPYVSLSQAFRPGASVKDLVADEVLHPHMEQLIPFPNVHGHQETAIRSIVGGRTTLVSTGTGSGKSECFLYPVISRCLRLRDEKQAPGICTVIVYPMNALAEDQLGRLRELLAGSGIPFGMYVGKTPERDVDVAGRRMSAGTSNAQYLAAVRHELERESGNVVHPAEEVCSRELMRTPGRQPRILLTNVKQLELLLTRQKDVELFDGASLDFLVFDEAHTFTGAQGAEVACLIRRLRSFCGRDADQTVCVATSATIVDREDPDAARNFASRFFGVEPDKVVTVNEEYQAQDWAETRRIPPAPNDPTARLKDVLAAVDAGDDGAAVRDAWRGLTGAALGGKWDEALYGELRANALLYEAAQLLQAPRPLSELKSELEASIERAVTEEELILWLTLGAAARLDGRALVRPVVHGFVRGVSGAIVTFDDDGDAPRLWLSAEGTGDGDRLRMRVSTCTTCGQHYFEHSLSDFEFTGAVPGGGRATGDAVYWEALDAAHGGTRVLFVDSLISADDDDDDGGDHHRALVGMHLCRICGTAHAEDSDRCLHCGREGQLLVLQAVRQRQAHRGMLARCVSCGANGRDQGSRFREPARPVRATNVSDVHVLAQDMIHHAERRRLLVFADNRQDAAFQSGWMQDHARRFRLRSMMARALDDGPLSVADLRSRLDKAIGSDDALSRALLPEIWAVAPEGPSSSEHMGERRFLLRILILRELTMGLRQRLGLEPWGRLEVRYRGLDESAPFVRKWAQRLGMPGEELNRGIAALLDRERRRRLLLDRIGEIFTRFWAPGDRALENGYLPQMNDVPKGLKLTREFGDDQNRVTQWISPTGHRTGAKSVALKWGVQPNDVETFLRELWAHLTSPETAVLVPATLKGSHGNALPACSGTHQVDADRLVLAASHGAWRCRTCRRLYARQTPKDLCLDWNCSGQIEFVPEDRDNYDLQLLDQDYSMVRPREHTAMVPTDEREKIEQIFKGKSDAINTLVCTQTLELGVDIGALDAVLMRNVPPLPANYWQRAGRAGRRQRMAVNVTYCRPVSHDRAYFADPPKMLGGLIEPPAFHLSNDLMVAKHVHATVITVLHQLARERSRLPDSDRAEIRGALDRVFPPHVKDYLFNEHGEILGTPRSVDALRTVVTKHDQLIFAAVVAAFRQGWPKRDDAVVTETELRRHVDGMTGELERVVLRLFRRLAWALEQMKLLDRRRARLGVLADEDEAFHWRCKQLVKRLKGMSRWDRGQGIDDVVTYSVLAAEGFLPGYGLDTGTVVGMAEVPRSVRGLRDFDLPRVPSVALREYVPGNLIYANGQRFVPKRYSRPVGEDHDVLTLAVDGERQAIRETTVSGTGAAAAGFVTSIPISDVTLVHTSRISDEEESRFQLGVSIYGRELDRHNGGQAYEWAERSLHLRKAVRLQLVNVGATSVIRSRGEFGYPVCRACGQSVSPLSSQRQRDDFRDKHQEWCGRPPEGTAFHADLAVDALSLPACSDRTEAYSMAEALRFGAAEVLDMDLEDLQVLVLARHDSDQVDALLYDPMPGGSGLLDQICTRFSEVARAAGEIAAGCPSLCSNSCIDCFQRYRNAFYHEHLDRHLMIERFEEWGDRLDEAHSIPPQLPQATPDNDQRPANEVERRLRGMLKAAGLPDGRWQERRMLAPPLMSTTPDITYDDPDDPDRHIFVYLDGLSKRIHGDPEVQAVDRQIRAELRSEGHTVVEIAVSDLDDRQAMSRHLKRLARELVGLEAVRVLSNDDGAWFGATEMVAERLPDGVAPPSGHSIAADPLIDELEDEEEPPRSS